MTLLIVWAVGAILMTAVQTGARSVLTKRTGKPTPRRARAMSALMALSWPLSIPVTLAASIGRALAEHVKDDK